MMIHGHGTGLNGMRYSSTTGYVSHVLQIFQEIREV